MARNLDSIDADSILDSWEQYLEAENVRIRSVTLEKLELFLAMMEQADSSFREQWVVRFVREHIDSDRFDFPLRMPMFRRLIFPILAERLSEGAPLAARSLAYLNQFLYKNPDLRAQLPEDSRTSLNLYRRALIDNPLDGRSRAALASELHYWLDYSLHELPDGVLYGSNGAALENLPEMLAELQEYQEVCASHVDEALDQELLEACRFHYLEYGAFLKGREPSGTYSDYLAAAHPDGWPRGS